MIPEIKICTKCKVEKPKEEFRIRKTKYKDVISNRLNSDCKSCEKIAIGIYKKNNQEKIKETRRAFRKKNRDKINVYKKEYRLANLERHRDAERDYYYKNLTKMKLQKRRDYEKHKEERIKKQKIYIQNRPEIRLKCSRNWRKNHPDKVLDKATFERKEMVDSYIVDILVRTSKLKRQQIKAEPELIKLTRTLIQLKRKIKDEQTNELSGLS